MVFQVRSDNPLVGLEGRAALLNRLGQVVAQNDDVFGREDSPRPGGLFDLLAGEDEAAIVPAPAILEAVLLHLGAIWPGWIALGPKHRTRRKGWCRSTSSRSGCPLR
jgi:hypothetical protein